MFFEVSDDSFPAQVTAKKNHQNQELSKKNRIYYKEAASPKGAALINLLCAKK
ncbi:hypothetical protein [Paenibacillus odorifer]|uniref:hypothetical protein n=1 Tax=Paenibacillus odorifer TaxID=189426 RepID=UPI0013A69A2E|nr:hypothetical protein [Paenibacillus odorifer]